MAQTISSYTVPFALMAQASMSVVQLQSGVPVFPLGDGIPIDPRLMPTDGVLPQGVSASPYAQSTMIPQPPISPHDKDNPCISVGFQSRGILPSAPIGPAPPTASIASTKAHVPQRNADGRFTCPWCTNTYLRAKNLKRHMPRHTGNRLYMCVLCREKFFRSDVLKRHFQKCSIRRGNPPGGRHLTQQTTSKPTDLGHNQGTKNGMENGTENPVNFDRDCELLKPIFQTIIGEE
ncbi:hypothetical protein F5883DRAFT_508676 [Diaporthe sp. PMI_573]|nr:hypothetical protein F5883DRAFT_508676 [Diaporthaceae sp. PMI_573]